MPLPDALFLTKVVSLSSPIAIRPPHADAKKAEENGCPDDCVLSLLTGGVSQASGK